MLLLLQPCLLVPRRSETSGTTPPLKYVLRDRWWVYGGLARRSTDELAATGKKGSQTSNMPYRSVACTRVRGWWEGKARAYLVRFSVAGEISKMIEAVTRVIARSRVVPAYPSLYCPDLWEAVAGDVLTAELIRLAWAIEGLKLAASEREREFVWGCMSVRTACRKTDVNECAGPLQGVVMIIRG